jgi:hypothetical protein
MKKIPLTQGKFAIVDDEDYELLSQRKWCAIKWGNTFAAITNGQKNIKGHPEMIYMHRLIIGLKKGQRLQVDHINHNGLDNRGCNLRLCTAQQNQWNYTKASNKSSKYKGVCRHKCGGWTAYINKNKKLIYLGYFKTEIEAAETYNAKAKELFGEFAKLNNIRRNGYEYQIA